MARSPCILDVAESSPLSGHALIFSLTLLVSLLLVTPSISTAAANEVKLRLVIPGTTYEIVVGESQLDGSGKPKRRLASSVASWLSAEFDLRPPTELPAVELVPFETLIAVRYGAHGVNPPARNARPEVGHEIVALYDDRQRIIYLSDDWTGRVPGEISALVHEMVHHLQNLAGASYGCPAEREKLAYQAQARFLALFGQSLKGEFSIDPMTLLVRTTCAM